jgi:integrase/recombinase XerD
MERGKAAMSEYVWNSSLADLMLGFLKEKRALGYIYHSDELTLNRLDRHLAKLGFLEKRLDKKIVMAWLQRNPNEAESSRCRRMTTINEFAGYLVRNNYDAYVIPHKCYPQYTKDFKAYIFTEDEITAFLKAAWNYPYDKNYPQKHAEIALLFSILVNCGLRRAEVTKLRVEDVDLEHGILTILNGKNGIDRIVPMADSLTLNCREYANLYLRNSKPDDFFFPGTRLEHLLPNTLYSYFRQLLWQCDISHHGKGKGPRLHDLRHTFAVHCLSSWVKNGTDLSTALPILSKYMGHVSIAGTQKYLQFTADMYPDTTQKLEKIFGYVIPKGGNENENY